jgi:hypothetical protein
MNECEWAEQMISRRDLGKKPTETLARVSRYYADSHYGKKEIRRMLDEFMLQCDPTVNLSVWSDTLDKIARASDKYAPIKLDCVRITGSELKTIEKLGGKQLRRLAFTLLCLAKYWDAAHTKNNHWVNTQDKDIMQMANIRTSIKRQSLLFGQLKDAGLIKFSKRIDNLNVQVLFVSDDRDTEMEVRDFRNLGYQYLMHYGGKYFECENCGIVTPKNDSGRPPKYCPSCSSEIRTRQNVNSVMRCRGIKS